MRNSLGQSCPLRIALWTAGAPAPRHAAWKDEPDQGGILLDLGTHLVDQALDALWPAGFSSAPKSGASAMGTRGNDSFTIRLHYFTGVHRNSWRQLPVVAGHDRVFICAARKGNYWKWGLDPQEEALGKITRIEAADWGKEPADHWGTLAWIPTAAW